MLISPLVAIEKGWVSLVDGSEIPDYCIQPNAIDFTVDRVFGVDQDSATSFMYDEVADGEVTTHKKFNSFYELSSRIQYLKYKEVDAFTLDGRTSYDFLSNFQVDLPEGVAALLVVRSTGNRQMLFITSGLYDSGYKGLIGACLHNNNQLPVYLGRGVRIGQIMFVASDSASLYAGGYNHTGDEKPKHLVS